MSGLQTTATPAIEPDNTGSEDSDDSICTDFESIASTIPNYVYQDGRRYHSRHLDNHILPNDEREQERMDFCHHVFRLTLDGGLCYTKLKDPQKILDIGTGTGTWAMDMADEFPEAEIIGTDLSPIQPGLTPDNVQFIVDDAANEWSFQESSFDFIHIRTLGGSIPDWPFLLDQCYQRLRPGGQIEVSEARTRFCCDDDTYPDGCRTKFWVEEFARLSRQAGHDFDIFPRLSGWMQDAGFTDVETVEKVVPVGTWAKDKKLKTRGRYLLALLLGNGLETFSVAAFCRVGGWSCEDVRTLTSQVSEELLRKKMHIYTHFSFALAKKPLTA